MRRVAVLQSNYLPWKGYFDIIHRVDVFVFYDDVQYTKNDWRNRNRIKTPQGSQWLTVPVGASLDRLVCDVTIPDVHWQQKHYKTLTQCYARAPHFDLLAGFLQDTFLEQQWQSLSQLNQHLIRTISRDFLNITTEFRDSREFAPDGRKADRLLDLLQKMKAEHYLSGPSARGYIDEAAFNAAGIQLEYMDYGHYAEYPQLFPPFDHYVSVLDLLFMTGRDAPQMIWGGAKS